MNADFHIAGKEIETERLILRAFKESDLDDFYEYARVEGVGEMAGWIHHKSKEETHIILESFIQGDKTFAITLKETGKVIGSFGVERYAKVDLLTEFQNYRGRELGFVLSKDYWGQGLMAEAVKAVIDYLFNDYDLDFLLCGHYAFNTQSARVQEKCGFKPYRKLRLKTISGIEHDGYMNLLINPKHNITLEFSHPETLIWKD